MSPIRLAGSGYFVPPRVLSNQDLEKFLDTTDEWITKRTGIRERRVAEDDQSLIDLSLPAAQKALSAAGIEPSELDLIIVATITPDTCCPSASNWLQGRLGASNAVAFDITAACSGFIFGLDIARRFLATGGARKALVVGAEVMSQVQDWSDRTASILWGDGAGAAVLVDEDGGSQLLDTYIGSDGGAGQNVFLPSAGSSITPLTPEKLAEKKHLLYMQDGKKLLPLAVRYFTQSMDIILERNGYTLADVDHIVPHQANKRIIDNLVNKLNIPAEKWIINIDRYGNTSAASCAIAFAEAVEQGRIQRGDLVCFTVFGGGITWGSALVRM